MFLDLKDLTRDELIKKMNQLTDRLRYMHQFGSGGAGMYQQCSMWIDQIEMELQERTILENKEESGTVAIIGEKTKEED